MLGGMDDLTAIEKKFGFKLPADYRKFVERGYIWGTDYLWVHEAEWIPPQDIPDYEMFGTPKPGLVPFAFGGSGDPFCWQTQRITSANEPAVVLCPHDSFEGEWYAPSFMGWLYRTDLDYSIDPSFEEDEKRENLKKWADVLWGFGQEESADDLAEISYRPLRTCNVGRNTYEYLLSEDEARERLRSAFGNEYVDAPYIWDIDGESAS
jgi:hypothetical protein